jgi:7,8-dihydroneopterin aldolase/epimerase/oxygenase
VSASDGPDAVGLGRIELRDLRVVGRHGVLPEERQRAQPFSLDLDLWLDLDPASDSDDLDDTADYGSLAALAASTVSDRSYRLLEALAGAVADQLLDADDRVAKVAVTVRKLRPPVPLDLASAGVTIERSRPVDRGR